MQKMDLTLDVLVCDCESGEERVQKVCLFEFSLTTKRLSDINL